MTKIKIGKQLIMINHAMRRRAENEGQQSELMRISMANGYILRYLHENINRDVFQKDFEEAFGITRSSASKIVSLMETKGLVQRQSIVGDARLKKITLTDKGSEMLEMIFESHNKMENQLTKGFSQEELERLCEYLQRMMDNLK